MTRRNTFIYAPTLMLGLMFGVSNVAKAQGPPVIPGLTGTLITKSTHEKEYAGAKKIIDKTGEGIGKVIGSTDGVDELSALREGSTVLVHYAVTGEARTLNADSLNVTEGVVWRIDHPREQIAIKYSNGKIENYRLAEHAVVQSGNDVNQPAAGAKRIKVTYKDGHGRPIEQFFKKKTS